MVLDAVQGSRGQPPEATIRDWQTMFPQVVTPPQALHEALDVYRNLTRIVVNPQQAGQAAYEILEDCLEGHAVFPGSDGRRDLFNWLLVQVVPAAWVLRLPEAIYTLHRPWPPNLVEDTT